MKNFLLLLYGLAYLDSFGQRPTSERFIGNYIHLNCVDGFKDIFNLDVNSDSTYIYKKFHDQICYVDSSLTYGKWTILNNFLILTPDSSFIPHFTKIVSQKKLDTIEVKIFDFRKKNLRAFFTLYDKNHKIIRGCYIDNKFKFQINSDIYYLEFDSSYLTIFLDRTCNEYNVYLPYGNSSYLKETKFKIKHNRLTPVDKISGPTGKLNFAIFKK